MMRVLTAEQTRSLETRAAALLDTDVFGLMTRVGEEVARQAGELAPQGRISVVTGKGNNGGDGWVAARVLHEQGREVRVVALAPPGDLGGEAATAANAALEAGVDWGAPDAREGVGVALEGSALVVDAIFGFGVRGAVEGEPADAIEAVNGAGATVLSVDMPSGVESDTGSAHGAAVRADRTLSVLAPKVGHVLFPGAALAGRLDVAYLGIAPEELDPGEGLEVWSAAEYAALLPVPGPEDHKGSRGRVLVVGGSGGMAGSVCLAGEGALRAGAGYVTIAVPASLVDVVNAKVTPAVAVALPETAERTIAAAAAERVLELAADADAVLIGPGLTTHEETSRVVAGAVERIESPLVVDADGLNALAPATGPLSAGRGTTVVTPHPGELARLLASTVADVQSDRPGHGGRLADDRVTCLLKGARTIVSGEGRQVVTMTGNPGLATMGTGDVLAGMVGTFLAQGLSGLEAGALASHLHGLAGDAAAEDLTAVSLTAVDLLRYLPEAVGRVLDAGTGHT